MLGANTRLQQTALAIVLAGVLMGFAPLVGACVKREAPQNTTTQEVSMKTVIMPVEGMSCSACVGRVKKALTSIDGVANVEVNLADRNARVRFDPSKLSPERLAATVNGLGYRAGVPAEAR